MSLTKVYIALVTLACISLVGYALFRQQRPPVPASSQQETAPEGGAIEEYVGIITPGSTSTTLRYTSTKYGVTFEFPRNWHIGDNSLGYGTFQIFNVPEEEQRYKNPDVTKIEMTIADNGYSEPSDVYIEESRNTTDIFIDGRRGIREDVVLAGKRKIRSYSVPLLGDEFLWISVYGNQENFHVLDELIETLRFIP